MDEDRFKTRTISKEDLMPGSPPPPRDSNRESPRESPRTLKQRRAEEAERFRTQTNVPADILLSPQVHIQTVSKHRSLSAVESFVFCLLFLIFGFMLLLIWNLSSYDMGSWLNEGG